MTDLDNEFDKVERRVRHGVEWLDGELGPRWPWMIDLSEFDIREPTSCILGQTADSIMAEYDHVLAFDDVVGEVGDPNYPLDVERASAMGFEIDHDAPMIIGCYDQYDVLQREWEHVIETRKAAG